MIERGEIPPSKSHKLPSAPPTGELRTGATKRTFIIMEVHIFQFKHDQNPINGSLRLYITKSPMVWLARSFRDASQCRGSGIVKKSCPEIIPKGFARCASLSCRSKSLGLEPATVTQWLFVAEVENENSSKNCIWSSWFF
jgi:hypothetical protein